MYPVFFSVTEEDRAIAEAIWGEFAADSIYLYSKTGRDGVWMWDEIERELKAATGFVIFWSQHYIRKSGTRREIDMAAKLFGQHSRLANAVILRLDDTPISCPNDATDEVRNVYEHLRSFKPTRFSEAGLSNRAMTARVDDLLRKADPISQPPFFERPECVEILRSAARIDHQQIRPAVWIQGMNGNGRRTMIKETYRGYAQNAVAIEISVVDTNLAKQFALRVASEALEYSDDALREINRDLKYDTPAGLAELVVAASEKNMYLIVFHDIAVEMQSHIPQWLVDMIKLLPIGRKPVVYCVSPLPAPADAFGGRNDAVGVARIPWFDQDQSERFLERLSAFFVPPSLPAWTIAQHQAVIKIASGNPKLLVDIARACAANSSIEAFENIAAAKGSRFSESLSQLIAWHLAQFSTDGLERKILRALSMVSPITFDLLQEFFPEAVLSNSLNRLVESGLVDQWGDGLYRIAPLLKRRMYISLNDRSLIQNVEEALRKFASKPRVIPSGAHTYLRIEAAISAGLRITGKAPEIMAEYVSAAHQFEAGIRLYNAKDTRNAFPLLREAFISRAKFDAVGKAEATRYYGLAACRLHKHDDVEGAINGLKENKDSEGLVAYIEGFRSQLSGDFSEAVNHYTEAYNNAFNGRADRRREMVSRPMISCILKSKAPNFNFAEMLAKATVDRNPTLFALRSYAEVCLRRIHKDTALSEPQKDRLWSTYLDMEDQIKKSPQGKTMYAAIASLSHELDGELEDALSLAKEAAQSERLEDKFAVWHLQLLLESSEGVEEVVTQVSAELKKQHSRARDELLSPTLSYGVKALRKLDKTPEARNLFRTYQSNLSDRQAQRIRKLLDVDLSTMQDAEHLPVE